MCSELRVQRYTSKLSGPLLDRIDIHLEVPRLAEEELLNHKPSGSSSADIRQRVAQARQMQVERYAGLGMYTNAEMTPPQIRQFCALDKPSTELLRRAIQKMNLSARTVDRLLRLARTIADLASHPELTAKDVAEALQYRAFDRLYQQSRPAAVAV
jgi:magnesium chelatase family protein